MEEMYVFLKLGDGKLNAADESKFNSQHILSNYKNTRQEATTKREFCNVAILKL
jgi:hypothetical protein